MARNRPDIGPYSRLLSHGSIDGRSREGRFLRSFETELTKHLGNPSATQRLVIKQLAQLALRLALMDEKAGAAGEFSERDGRQYLAWANALSRGLRTLGLEGKPAAKRTLQQHIDANYGRSAPAAAA